METRDNSEAFASDIRWPKSPQRQQHNIPVVQQPCPGRQPAGLSQHLLHQDSVHAHSLSVPSADSNVDSFRCLSSHHLDPFPPSFVRSSLDSVMFQSAPCSFLGGISKLHSPGGYAGSKLKQGTPAPLSCCCWSSPQGFLYQHGHEDPVMVGQPSVVPDFLVWPGWCNKSHEPGQHDQASGWPFQVRAAATHL